MSDTAKPAWRRDWSERDVDRLRLCCDLGMPIEWAAEELKRDTDECVDKANELKLHVTSSRPSEVSY